MLVTTESPPLHLAADESSLYWTEEGGALRRVSKNGGASVLLAAIESGTDAAFGQLAVDSSDVYVIETGERPLCQRE